MNFRKQAPLLREIRKIGFKQPSEHVLDNGIPVYEVKMGTQAILKLDIVFLAGRWYEQKPLAARLTARLLKEGCRLKNSAEIAEYVDFYGGTLKTAAGLDTAVVSLYCLSKHFDRLAELLYQMLKEPTFPEAELADYSRTAKQKLIVEQSKNDVVSYREITRVMFGDSHPYGYNSVPETYDQIGRADLLTHFKNHFRAGNCKMILSGKTEDSHIKRLNSLFGQDFPLGKSTLPSHLAAPLPPQKISLRVPGSVQSAIHIGKPFVVRKHPDYFGLFVLNTLLGGYFGSRLMENIREDKGYSYGIYSTIDTMLHGSYFYISTEAGTKVADATIKETYHEINRLRQEKVGREELQRVRNYMLGTILTSLDGPFNVASLVKTLVLEDLDASFFQKLVDTIKVIDGERLLDLAQTYFKAESFYEVRVD